MIKLYEIFSWGKVRLVEFFGDNWLVCFFCLGCYGFYVVIFGLVVLVFVFFSFGLWVFRSAGWSSQGGQAPPQLLPIGVRGAPTAFHICHSDCIQGLIVDAYLRCTGRNFLPQIPANCSWSYQRLEGPTKTKHN